jgi:hypothetical protein
VRLRILDCKDISTSTDGNHISVERPTIDERLAEEKLHRLDIIDTEMVRAGSNEITELIVHVFHHRRADVLKL